MNWSSFPFLRFVITFILGIICSINNVIPFDLSTSFISFLTIYIIVWIVQKIRFRTQLKPLLGFLALATIFCFGFEITKLRTEKLSENHLINLKENQKIIGVKGFLVERIKESDKSYKTIINITKANIDSNWVDVEGKILCYFSKDSLFNLKYGNEVVISSNINEVDDPKNPEEFNYKKYLSFHNIHHRLFIKSHQYKKIEGNNLSLLSTPNLFIYNALKIRSYLENQLKKQFKNKRELGIAQALILGVKDELENDIIKAYSGVGAMHVLAVSGLHVGLIYQVFILIFGFISKRGFKINKVLQAIFLLLFIWIYAFITGLSPSVIRASAMFSFIIIADATGKNTNIYNTLAVSAFTLLCINPFLIVEVGFQLSYLAVIGIVYLQPKIYDLFKIQNNLLDKIWGITCVSIAAQIATFPLGLLYFHQFPTYFFISNIIVIPAAIFILYGGISVLLFSWSDSIAFVLSYILEKVIWAVNEVIILINMLPNSLIDEVNIGILESVIIYLIVLSILLFMSLKRLKIYVLVFGLMCCFSFIQLNENLNQSKNKKMIFYSVNKSSAIAFQNGKNITFLADSSLLYNEDKLHFHIKNHWWKDNIENVEKIEISNLKEIKGNKYFVWNDLHFLFYEKIIRQELLQEIEIDYFILRNNVWVDKEKIEANFNIENLVIDGTNNWKTRNFAKQNFENAIDLIGNGAEVIEF